MTRTAWSLCGAGVVAFALAGYWVANPGHPRHVSPELNALASGPAAHGRIAAVAEKPSLQPLFDDMVDGDAAKKAAAMEQLAQLPPDRRNDLRIHADKTLLPDLAALLNRRASEMDDQIALDPPPISLHVQNAGLVEVLSDLSIATGASFDAFTDFNGAGAFSLDVDQRPFWEVVTLLARQSPIWIHGSHDRLVFSTAPRNRGIDMTCTRGPFCLFTMRMPERPAAVRYALAADPRTLLLGYHLSWTVVDAAGSAFDLPSRAGVTSDKLTPLFQFNSTSGSDEVNLSSFRSAHPDAVIAAYKIHARLAVGLQIARGEFGGIEKGPDISQSSMPPAGTVGGVTVTAALREMSVPGNNPITQFDVTALRGNAPAWQAFRVRDSSGTLVAGMCTSGGGGISSMGGTPPYSLQILVPQQIKYFELEFELKPDGNLGGNAMP